MLIIKKETHVHLPTWTYRVQNSNLHLLRDGIIEAITGVLDANVNAASKVMPPTYFLEKTTDTMGKITLFYGENSYSKTLFFNIVTTINYTFLPTMKKSLYATLISTYITRSCPLFL